MEFECRVYPWLSLTPSVMSNQRITLIREEKGVLVGFLSNSAEELRFICV